MEWVEFWEGKKNGRGLGKGGGTSLKQGCLLR
jgi:hypothetical protein